MPWTRYHFTCQNNKAWSNNIRYKTKKEPDAIESLSVQLYVRLMVLLMLHFTIDYFKWKSYLGQIVHIICELNLLCKASLLSPLYDTVECGYVHICISLDKIYKLHLPSAVSHDFKLLYFCALLLQFQHILPHVASILYVCVVLAWFLFSTWWYIWLFSLVCTLSVTLIF